MSSTAGTLWPDSLCLNSGFTITSGEAYNFNLGGGQGKHEPVLQSKNGRNQTPECTL